MKNLFYNSDFSLIFTVKGSLKVTQSAEGYAVDN